MTIDSDGWFCIMWVGIVACIFAAGTVDRYIKHCENVKAMEAGYVQQLVDGHELWVKE